MPDRSKSQIDDHSQRGGPTKHVAAICATPLNNNTGMHCVDLSLKTILEKFDALSVDYYCFETSNLMNEYNEIAYDSIMNFKKREDYDAVIIWGDFILTRSWIKMKSMRISKEKQLDERAVLDYLYDVIFPEEAELRRRPRIIFGQCFLLDGLAVCHDEKYMLGLKRSLKGADMCLFRDPVSAYKASILSGEPVLRFAGVDAALLLAVLWDEPDTIVSPDGTPKNRVGIFLGRTKGAYLTKIALAYALFRKPELKPVWFKWLTRRNIPNWPKFLFRTRSEIKDRPVEEFIKEISDCALVISDTYHMALISWSFGTPAICIGDGGREMRNAVGDKKKEIFYMYNGLQDFYLYSENWRENLFGGRAREALEKAMNSELGQVHRRRLNQMAEYCLQAIYTALAKVA